MEEQRRAFGVEAQTKRKILFTTFVSAIKSITGYVPKPTK